MTGTGNGSAGMVRSLVLVIMLVLGFQSGIVAATVHEEDCISRGPAVQRHYIVKHVRPAAFEKIAGANKHHTGHTKSGKAGSCCAGCTMVAIVIEACQNAVTARQLDVVPPPVVTTAEQIRLTGLRRPPRSLLNV